MRKVGTKLRNMSKTNSNPSAHRFIFTITKLLDAEPRAFDGIYLMQVEARGPRGVKVVDLSFASFEAASTCIGRKFDGESEVLLSV